MQLSTIFFHVIQTSNAAKNKEPQPPREGVQVEPRNVPTWDTRLSYLHRSIFQISPDPVRVTPPFEIVCKGTTFFAHVQIFSRKNLIFRELQSRQGRKKILSKIGYYGTEIGFYIRTQKIAIIFDIAIFAYIKGYFVASILIFVFLPYKDFFSFSS